MLSILRQRATKHALLSAVLIKSKLPRPTRRDQIYFGYGANLSVERFTRRKMNVREIGNAVLRGYEIKFTLSNEYKHKGYAGIHEHQNGEVWGVLYEMNLLSLRLLDSLEWCGFGAYERKKVTVKMESGDTRQCWCYFVKNPKFDLFPSKTYLNNMVSAAEGRKFPESYISFLKSHNSHDQFTIDHGFSLLFYGKRRPLEKILLPIYRWHDKLREKLCELI